MIMAAMDSLKAVIFLGLDSMTSANVIICEPENSPIRKNIKLVSKGLSVLSVNKISAINKVKKAPNNMGILRRLNLSEIAPASGHPIKVPKKIKERKNAIKIKEKRKDP